MASALEAVVTRVIGTTGEDLKGFFGQNVAGGGGAGAGGGIENE